MAKLDFFTKIILINFQTVYVVSFTMTSYVDNFSGYEVGDSSAPYGAPINGAEFTPGLEGKVWNVDSPDVIGLPRTMGVMLGLQTLAEEAPNAKRFAATEENASLDLSVFGSATNSGNVVFRFALFPSGVYQPTAPWGVGDGEGQPAVPKHVFSFTVPFTPATPFFLVAALNTAGTFLATKAVR